MWTMTPAGFFSAVQHRDDPTLLVVRTRDRSDADHLVDWYATWAQDLIALWADTKMAGDPGIPDAEVVAYPVSDYPWRVIVPKAAWAAFLAEAVEDLDYGNFKDAVKKAQGPDRAMVYTNVWSALLRLEDLDPLGRRPKALEDSDWGPYDAWETSSTHDDGDLDWDDEDAVEAYYLARGWVNP
jgi:hypothetical protein